ncbi:MAG: class I fructose-bisphosphate aldolase [Patescibacteria group bacterium]
MTTLYQIAKQIVANKKGILAADESTNTANKRFAAVNVEQTEEMRRQYRQLLFSTPGIEQFLSGVILFNETIRQKTDNGMPFAKLLQGKNIIPGIKADQGTIDFENHPGEKIAQGLVGLAERLQEYYAMGARFTKWRAVLAIDQGIPTEDAIKENARILAEYAAISQTEDFVPIVEPEVLLDGDHSIKKAEEVTINTLKTVFDALQKRGVDLQGLILKSSMVLSGKECAEQADAKQVAEATIRALKNSVPVEVAGVVFLSGGQSPQQATENLNEIIKLGPQPWPLTFSFSRALQEPVLKTWRGAKANVEAAQQAFLKRLRLNQAALSGSYTKEMES